MTKTEDSLHAMRHSAAHVLAAAISHLYPGVKLGVGPVIENGFYYDIDIDGVKLSATDFPKIEKEMASIIADKQPFTRSSLSIDKAITWAKDAKQPYKLELLNDLKTSGTTNLKDINPEELGNDSSTESKVKEVSFYVNGDFMDLCRGPHVASTSDVGPFKLTKISGAYWRGNEKGKQLQRIYGVAFQNQADLEAYLKMVELAKSRDHRKLGQELDLFVISDLVGPGLPLFTPRGTVLRNELIRYSEDLQIKRGYEEVWAPHMARVDLYKSSGHYDKFPERFDVASSETDDSFMLKPMNCPHVIQIYASKPRSYRDLPLRYMETTTMYRDEKSGELHGLSRVRSLTQDDSHAFVRHDQIKDEITSVLSMIKEMYQTLDMPLRVELSFRDDDDKYFGDPKLWEEAQKTIESIAKEQKLDYQVMPGEAAFYGPKIDVHVSDGLGRSWQLATVQLDFVMPERFDLYYTNSDSEKERPAMVHKAILGSIERFLSVYIEHTGGRFPVWLAPEQIRILTLNQTSEISKFANNLLTKAKDLGLRATVDNDNQSVGKKIREAEMLKVPYVLVIGDREVSSKMVTPRIRQDLLHSGKDVGSVNIEDFINTVKLEYSNRSLRTSF